MSTDSQFTTSTIPTQSTPSTNRYGLTSVLPQEGEMVRVHYFIDPAFRHEIYDCTVEAVKEKSLFGPMLKVKPVLTEEQTAKFGELSPRWVTLHQLAAKQAPVTTQKALTEDELYAEQYRLMKLVDPAYQAWDKAFMEGVTGAALEKLNQAHLAADEAYQRARKAYNDCRKKEAVTPAAPTPAPVSAEAETPRTGRVSCYDAKNDYGYIVSKGQSFYFQTRHLKYSNMTIKGGDTVTFSVWESRTGMPKATGIVVEGYVAPVNPAVERAQAEARKTAEREARRKAILEAGRANRQSALKSQGA